MDQSLRLVDHEDEEWKTIAEDQLDLSLSQPFFSSESTLGLLVLESRLLGLAKL